MKKWPPPKPEYKKALFTLALHNKKAEAYMHRRARGSKPLCGQNVGLDRQTLEDSAVTCPVCIAKLHKF